MSEKQWDGEAVKVKPTMTVNMLHATVHGKDRDKQLIVGWRNPDGSMEFIDVDAAVPNEDNVELGTANCPAE